MSDHRPVSDPFEPLRRDVSYLGRILGDTLVEQEGKDLLDLEETFRALAKERRGPGEKEPAGSKKLASIVRHLDTATAEKVARAFTHYFQLVNLAEQHHRTRRRRDHARAKRAQPGSLEVVFKSLAKEMGEDAARFEELLARTSVELVFTAHPSEAQRRTVLEKHRRLTQLLAKRDRTELTPEEAAGVEASIREEVGSLWQTDEIRQAKPRVGDEVKNVLFYLEEILFPLVPRFYAALEAASTAAFGRPVKIPTVLHFGSWVGADMDGNPNVTPEVAIDTGLAMTARVLDLYLHAVDALGATLSQSTRRAGVSKALLASLETDAAAMPELALTLEKTTEEEPYRRKVRFIGARLAATRTALVDYRQKKCELAFPEHAYRAPEALLADLALIRASLAGHRGAHAGLGRVDALVRQVETFRFHLAKLDVRIPAEWVRADAKVVLGGEVTLEALSAALEKDPATLPRPDGPGIGALEGLARIRALTFDGGADSFILSMTRGAEDMLAALLLARIVGLAGDPAKVSVVPLFETLDDLERSADELERAVGCAPYAAYLKRRGGVHELMLGYSDSNKDAGIIGSSYALYRAQQRLVAVAEQHGIALKIFHGRGGSIGRGGGPSQRAIESLPAGSVSGRFKLTEQGEVLGWKYLVPEIAERNLELTVAGVVAQTFHSEASPRTVVGSYEKIFDEVAARSVAHYRSLIHDPDFPEYYATTTPIEEIPRLNIGSRPARRTQQNDDAPKLKLEDLRAIPWVFAWTQSRQMVPGWYGAGHALTWLLRTHGVEAAQRMRKDWPFWSSTLDAIATALAQADMPIAARYAALLGDKPSRRLFQRVARDHARAVRAVAAILGQDGRSPLAKDATLARSIELRNPYVDPLSFVQIELLRRKRASAAGGDELGRAILLTINGLAAGLRSTG